MSSTNSCSFCLNKNSLTSIIEKDLLFPKHKYFTRLSVKTNQNQDQLSNRDYLGNRESVGKKEESVCSDNSLYLDEDLDLGYGSFTLDNEITYNPLVLLKKKKMRSRCRGMNMEYPDMCRPNKCSRYLLIFLAVALLGIAVTFINDRYSESHSSFRQIKREISNIINQMVTMKEDVESVVNAKEDTEKKLDKIAEILQEIKTTQTQTNTKCPLKPDDKPKDKAKENFKKIVKEVLEEYDADKTGLTDFALESAGARILTTRDTEDYPTGKITLMGLPICKHSNGPRVMLQPGTLPGECWAFKGSEGTAIIELVGHVFIQCISIEHLSKKLSPTGEISAAPKEFSVKGLSCTGDKKGVYFGRFTYNVNGPPIQYFTINNNQKSFKFIEFTIHSNHGNDEFTCVYRFRVHGKLDSGYREKLSP